MAANPKWTAGDGDDLLPELRREILTRVPVKSILRFRSVCKSWYSLISCPNFISDYFVRNPNQNRNRLLLHCGGRVLAFRTYNEPFMEYLEHDYIPEPFLEFNVDVVGSCNGLVCLAKHVSGRTREDGSSLVDFLVWNPSIRKVVEPPSRTYTQYPSHIGFGFDPNANDYKVLFVWPEKNADLSVKGEIFDLRKGVWRGISPMLGSSWHVWGPFQECYLDGAVHWSGFEGFDRIILSFNMIDELFRVIRMPDCAEFTLTADDLNDDDDHDRDEETKT